MLQIYHTVNAGLYLWNGRSGLMIDALHGGKAVGFSDTPDRYIGMMQRKEQFFGQTNDLLFTHAHEDHYDEELVHQFLSLNPDSFIYGPELDRSNVQPILLEQSVSRLQFRDYTIYAFVTKHDGKIYENCPHCSYLIQAYEQLLWVSGDAVLDVSLAEKVKESCKERRIDAAFVMVYQIESRLGMGFLKELCPEHMYLYHLPYKEDDRFHYYRMAAHVLGRRRRAGIPVALLKLDSFVG